jgi:hypothetical protein
VPWDDHGAADYEPIVWPLGQIAERLGINGLRLRSANGEGKHEHDGNESLA